MMDVQAVKALVSKAGNAAACSIPIISKFIEWITMPKGTDKEALDSLVKSINENPALSPIAKAAYISDAKRIIRQYKNQHDIVEIAINELSTVGAPPKSNLGEVEEEWISRFMESAAHVSEPNVQLMWGKILANKYLSPDDTPKVIIHILSTLDYKTAEAFQNLCRFVIRDEELFFPVVFWDMDKVYQDYGVHFMHLTELNTAGLISFDPTNGYARQIGGSILHVNYHNKAYEIKSGNGEIPSGNVVLTQAGECLYKAISPDEPPDDFLAMCINRWKNSRRFPIICSVQEKT